MYVIRTVALGTPAIVSHHVPFALISFLHGLYILVNCFPINQWLLNDIFSAPITMFSVEGTVTFCQWFSFTLLIPQADEARVLHISALLAKQEIYHFQINTILHLVFIIKDLLQDQFYIFIFFFELSNWVHHRRRGTYTGRSQLCNKTHFKLLLELSINSANLLAYIPFPFYEVVQDVMAALIQVLYLGWSKEEVLPHLFDKLLG